MTLRDWLQRIAAAGQPPANLPSRHARREQARERHAEGGPGWSESDRHLNPDGAREVADVTPGTPGHGGRRRIGGH